MIYNPPPCKDCSNRYIGCHSGCPTWTEWKNQEDARKEEISRIKKAESVYRSAQYERSVRFQRRLHNDMAIGRSAW